MRIQYPKPWYGPFSYSLILSLLLKELIFDFICYQLISFVEK